MFRVRVTRPMLSTMDNQTRRIVFFLKNNKCLTFIILLMISIIGFYVHAMGSHPVAPQKKLEDSFPPSIKVDKENRVMTPEELKERRKMEGVRLKLNKAEETAMYQKEREKRERLAQEPKAPQISSGQEGDNKGNPKKESSNPKYPDTQRFQVVKDRALSVFSAFIDKDIVRVLGYKLASYNTPPRCEFLVDQPANQSVKPPSVIGKMETLMEHHSRKFRACYILCQIPTGVKDDSILAVKVTASDGSGSATLPIQQSLDKLQGRTWQSEFSLCVAPIQNNFDNTNTLVEMVEFNRILGAQKFFFYNYSIGGNVSKVLRYYQDQGLVEIIDWKIPLKVGPDEVQPEIHYFGQLIAHNDCLYRNRKHSKYVVIQDLDEFIVPTTKDVFSWEELIQSRLKATPKSVVFQFKNCFIRKEWGANLEDLAKFEFKDKISKLNLETLSNVYREDEFYKHNLRSKCIVDPMAVITLGIHNIWKMTGVLDRVPETEAFVHHYRNFKRAKDVRKRVHYDLILEKFGAKLVGAVEKVWGEIGSKGLVGR